MIRPHKPAIWCSVLQIWRKDHFSFIILYLLIFHLFKIFLQFRSIRFITTRERCKIFTRYHTHSNVFNRFKTSTTQYVIRSEMMGFFPMGNTLWLNIWTCYKHHYHIDEAFLPDRLEILKRFLISTVSTNSKYMWIATTPPVWKYLILK